MWHTCQGKQSASVEWVQRKEEGGVVGLEGKGGGDREPDEKQKQFTKRPSGFIKCDIIFRWYFVFIST